ncbi:hypothetical protein A4A49_39496 [Nicotiana attenuata]|uniref:Uncharacterized protein n=1 Tax=Nicotiana attenuata TaxID=49451 RepID=A0A1J6JVB6_NICAT|nr:hypothetical protein A4A49_39496 [Nicotiana attenuata]
MSPDIDGAWAKEVTSRNSLVIDSIKLAYDLVEMYNDCSSKALQPLDEYKASTLHLADIHGQVKEGYIDVTLSVNSIQLRGYIIIIVTNADPDAVFEHYTDVADGGVIRWNGHGNGAHAADMVHAVKVDDNILHDAEVEKKDALSDIVVGMYEDVANLEE